VTPIQKKAAFLTLFGAYWTARSILLTPEQAAEMEPLKNALLKHSNDARAGLVCSGRSGLPDCQQAHRRILFVSKLGLSDERRNEQRPLAAIDGVKRRGTRATGRGGA
jgi:hypothetical protein